MEDSNDFHYLWTDPLLLTDVSWQQNTSIYTDAAMASRFENPSMSDSDSSPKQNSADVDDPRQSPRSNVISTPVREIDVDVDDPEQLQSSNVISTPLREIDGRSMLGFSLRSPDLVICTGSPDIPSEAYGDSAEFLEKQRCSFELSLENGIDGSDGSKAKLKSPTVKFSTVCQTFHKEPSPVSSFELLPFPETADNKHEHLPVISVNAGCLNGAVEFDGVIYSNDNCYVGGDVIIIGDGVGNSLYDTARIGDFSYNFSTLESGFYAIDMHFAEIVFTSGPPGIRVFDVFIQEAKVVSSLDIYGQVGANKPLVISNIRTFVDSGGGLLIRFEGLIGSPIVCGITIRKDSLESVGVGFVSALLFKYAGLDVDNLQNLGCCLFVLFPYFSYMLAEGVTLSGIVSILFTAIVMKHYTYSNLSENSQRFASSFFHLISSLAETFTFIYMGFDIAMEKHSWSHVGFICFSILFIIVARAVNVFSCAYLVNLFRPVQQKIPSNHQKALWYSGLRGAMAFALALQSVHDLPEGHGQIIFTATTAIIVLTVLLIGGSTGTMLEALQVVGDDHDGHLGESFEANNGYVAPSYIEAGPSENRFKMKLKEFHKRTSSFSALDKNYLTPFFTSQNEDDDEEDDEPMPSSRREGFMANR